MKCKVYPSVKSFNLFIISPSEVSVKDLPKQAQDEIGRNKSCEEIELSPERHQKAIAIIKSKGYYTMEIPNSVKIKEIEGQNPPK